MTEVKFSPLAYCKVILHAVKYPHASVNGVLLAPENAKRDGTLIIEDAVPLFHMALTLAPMAEVALQQIDNYASKNKLVVAGYYEASEFLNDHCDSRKANRISYKIQENFPGACFVALHNEMLSLDQSEVPLYATTKTDDSGCWIFPGKKVKLEKESITLHAASILINLQTYDELVDFDNHLDCPSKDWTNSDLELTIKEALSHPEEEDDDEESDE
ncbi:ER membrane protein complex subunit 8/9 homolog [Neocloeon triangulifer]|uniref:ER membrane protein complex subunit 8/9 homolog n=1 Tax=Neocloeon triangulifer TaxID=2078957 RepID=UPI00286F7CED|nr:ER membrane protein complex subunit 8/9 homolog [Neocloeon triangulifer]